MRRPIILLRKRQIFVNNIYNSTPTTCIHSPFTRSRRRFYYCAELNHNQFARFIPSISIIMRTNTRRTSTIIYNNNQYINQSAIDIQSLQITGPICHPSKTRTTDRPNDQRRKALILSARILFFFPHFFARNPSRLHRVSFSRVFREIFSPLILQI